MRFDTTRWSPHRAPVIMRRITARHRWLPWCAVVALALGTAIAVSASVRSVDTARERWGVARSVWVASGERLPGDIIVAEAVELPLAAVPGGAVSDDPNGQVSRQQLTDGEVIVVVDVARQSGVGALAEPGDWIVAVADPLFDSPPIGHSAAVVADGITLTEHARIVEVDGLGTTLLAVPSDDGPAVATAARLGIAGLALVP